MKFKQMVAYGSIVLAVTGFIAALTWKKNTDIAQIRTAYQSEQNAEIDLTVKNIETVFNDFYQGIRTMSLLPGVRSIDRYAKNFNPDSKAAMQQIYNNTYLNVTLSEVYILPAHLDPDVIDPITKKPEIPILTFDDFIVAKNSTDNVETEEKKTEIEEEKKTEIEEEEIYEYRLMKKQLAYLSTTFPSNSMIKGLDVPAVSGEEVITCDNTDFKKAQLEAHDDAPRKGIVLTVPRYDLKGNFAGAVSGVVRTNVIKKLFPASHYGLINKTHQWRIIVDPIKEWNDSVKYFEADQPNPNLIISAVRKINIVDSTPWYIWVAKSDADFYGRGDVKQAETIFYAGIFVSLLLGGLLLYGTWSSFTSQARLERKVDEKTSALSARNDQMALILNNAEEGFLTLNLDGTMEVERSVIISKWFGTSSVDTKFWDFIGAGTKNHAALYRIGWDQLIEDFMPFEISADQMPKLIQQGERSLSVKFKAVHDANGKLFKVLVMIADVTALVEGAKRELQQRELLAVFQNFSADRSGFRQFVDDAKKIVHRIAQRNDDSGKDIDFREVHTLKGNASQFGLLSVAEVCHKIETELSEFGRPLTNEERVTLRLTWEEASKNLKDFVNDSEARQLIIDLNEFDLILKEIRKVKGAESIFDKLSAWPLESTGVPFRRLGEQVKALANRLEKGDVEVVVKDNGVRLDSDLLRDFWMNATHLIRNTADHGFETFEERSKIGKGTARITFESILTPDTVVLTFSDNGRGIDWEKIRSVATQKKLPALTQKDLEAALFTDGVSTKDEVSQTSGRGVGMSAFKAAVASLGGVIEIASAPGKGTTFKVEIPRKMISLKNAA